MAIGAIAGSVLTMVKPKDLVKSILNPFKKKGCSSQDKAKRRDMEKLIKQYLTYNDMNELIALGNLEGRVSPTASSIAYFVMGEGDCFHKNVNPKHRQFLDAVPERVEQRMNEAMQKESSQNYAKEQSRNMNVSSKFSNPFTGNNAFLYGGLGLVGIGVVTYIVKKLS